MTRSLMTVVTIAVLAASTPLLAKPCRDAKGKFVSCASAASAPASSVMSNVKKDAKGRCHIASGPGKGRFIKCPK